MIYKNPVNRRLKEHGFERKGGNRFITELPGMKISFYNKHNNKDGMLRVNARAGNGKFIKIDYENVTVTNIDDVIDDAFAVIKEKYPKAFDDKEHIADTNTDTKPEPSTDDKFETAKESDVVCDAETSDDFERVVTFRAPQPDDVEYPISFCAVDDELPDADYKPLVMPYEETSEYSPLTLGYGSGDASDIVNTKLVTKVEERVFQPMNSYPNFPLRGDNNPSVEPFFETGDADAPRAVEVDLLSEARRKEGEIYPIEREEEFGTDDKIKKKLPSTMKFIKSIPPSIPITFGALGLGFVAYKLFFENRIQ